jgi:hypothetical protein
MKRVAQTKTFSIFCASTIALFYPFMLQAADANAGCSAAIANALPMVQLMLTKFDADITSGAFYTLAVAKQGVPSCSSQINDNITLQYQFPAGAQLLVEDNESIETQSQTLSIAGLSDKDADELLRKEGQNSFVLKDCKVDWTQPKKDGDDTVYSGQDCNCMARIERKGGAVTRLRISHVC